jgi:hypothetical protein
MGVELGILGDGIAQSVQRRATGWTARVRFPAGARFFSSLQCSDRFWGPPTLLSNGYRRLNPRVKREWREADHSPLSSAEVKNGGIIPPLPHMSLWHS